MITWPFPDFAPSNILSGPYKGQGVINHVNRILAAQLPQYEHRYTVANFKRVVSEIAVQKQVCGAALLKNPERASVTLYSEPYMLIFPARIIVTKDKLPLLAPYRQANGTYSLEALLVDGKLKLGHSRGRSYGPNLDALLNKYANRENAVVTSQVSVFEVLVKMLSSDRFDLTMGYVIELSYMQKMHKVEGDFVSLPISEASELLEVHVACPKNDWGRQIIDQLNRYIFSVKDTDVFYSGLLPWLDDNARAEYPKAVSRFTAKRDKAALSLDPQFSGAQHPGS